MSPSCFREPTDADRRTGFLVLAGYLTAIVLASALIFLLQWPDGMVAWLALVLVGTLLLARWNARHSGYRCARCGHQFEISTLTELASPHGSGDGGWKYLRCPACDQKSRAKVLVRER
jgi:DNA-directed RNA polymerase subunit RPC12/RpoP